MPSPETLIAFSFAALMLSISPGPSNLYIMARTMGQGQKAGTAAAGGMAIGSLIYVLATALGLATIFVYSPMAYTGVKIAGAIYLLYLGWQYLRQAKALTHVDKPHLTAMTPVSILRQSIIVELTNPKTALFFLAFLPQFVDASLGNVAMQMIVLGLTYGVIAFCSDMMVVILSNQLGRWLESHASFSLWQERVSGSILMVLGVYILGETWLEDASES